MIVTFSFHTFNSESIFVKQVEKQIKKVNQIEEKEPVKFVKALPKKKVKRKEPLYMAPPLFTSSNIPWSSK